ncbi:riboflavin kinase/FMN adenylyltransferase [Bacillus mesophilus]|uniref:Riboflavin biosynthesis protein n=1 Tax=Bacillus mesophilus TaxID=1808955 RepID=A0A6M0Q4S5_9BACI|nr:riboflavin kinase/FMN adenylyltransferase [Bacillus mesophilus]NEY70188.1 bifunctional riboflavin kinase/FAD synthetase [Bacillus mesophilus]
METIYLSHPPKIANKMQAQKVMAFGYFDGVHIGHQKVILTAKELAGQKGIKSAVMTFHPHPSVILRKEQAIQHMLTPLHEKIEAIEKLGIDELYIVDFSEEFSQLLPQEFVDEYIINLNVKHVVAGFDFTYGKMGKGTMETIPFHSRGQFTQTVIDKVHLQSEKISSSYIRKLLENGQVNEIPNLLGRFYNIRGKIVHGEKRGSTIGFPTANIGLVEPYHLPKTGVYAVELNVLGEYYKGVCNIGYKPTFHQKLTEKSIEVHLFDFDQNIYGESVELIFHNRIRDEQKFNGIQELVTRIHEDVKEAKEFFKVKL